jgi:hypothetical protein
MIVAETLCKHSFSTEFPNLPALVSNHPMPIIRGEAPDSATSSSFPAREAIILYDNLLAAASQKHSLKALAPSQHRHMLLKTPCKHTLGVQFPQSPAPPDALDTWLRPCLALDSAIPSSFPARETTIICDDSLAAALRKHSLMALAPS